MGLPLDQRLGSDVARVHQELMAVKQQAVKAAGLAVAQYKALYVLADAGRRALDIADEAASRR